MFVQDLVSLLPLSRPDPDLPPLNLPPDPLVVAPRLDLPDPPDPPDPPDLSFSRCRRSFYVDVALPTSGLTGSVVVSSEVCLSIVWWCLLPCLVFQLELWLSSVRTCFSFDLATVDAVPPPLEFLDLLNPSIHVAILLCALDIKCRYDFLFNLIDGSFASLVGKSLALVQFTTAVCSLLTSFTQDIESLMIIYLCLSSPLSVPVVSPCGYIGDTLGALVEPFTAVCRPVCAFILDFDVSRWLSLPLWQVEEIVFEVSTQLLNIVVLLTFSFKELVSFPYFPLLFSGCVAGSVVPKLKDTLLSSFRKGLANWCHVTYALTAIFLIVHSTHVVSISGYRSLNVLSKSHSSISSLSSFDVEVGGLLHDFNYLGVIIASILCMLVLRFVIAVCLANLALLSFTLNNYSMDGV